MDTVVYASEQRMLRSDCMDMQANLDLYLQIWLPILLPFDVSKTAQWVTKSIETDHKPYFASDLGLHCLCNGNCKETRAQLFKASLA